MIIIIKIGKGLLNGIYSLMKLLPSKNRITFISRQGNSPSLDIKMIVEGLNKEGIHTKVLCKKLEKGILHNIGYCFHMLRQMYNMATSKVVVLDGYCIAASLLHHKSILCIVQMWHALGAMKKFGYSILDQDEGSSSELAEVMRMHKNYNYVFVSGANCVEAYSEAFRYSTESIKVMPLPRVDALLDVKRSERIKKDIIKTYPKLREKETILYAPTFRKDRDISTEIIELVDAINFEKYNLIVKLHPLSDYDIQAENVIWDQKYPTIDMLNVCDYVITDYSAITFEAAVKNKPLFFYAPDLEKYINRRDFYFDYMAEMPGVIENNAKDVALAIERREFSTEKVREFADKYIDRRTGCTQEIMDFLISLLRK